ncbi:MAG: hypothetical protein HY010_16665 [Acidobacteria bacterium]|nr:hypothetical protein [Acidobacteriota bacterium]
MSKLATSRPVVPENSGFVDAPDHDMVPGAGNIEAGVMGDVAFLANGRLLAC